jgi:hypothetical protein
MVDRESVKSGRESVRKKERERGYLSVQLISKRAKIKFMLGV